MVRKSLLAAVLPLLVACSLDLRPAGIGEASSPSTVAPPGVSAAGAAASATERPQEKTILQGTVHAPAASVASGSYAPVAPGSFAPGSFAPAASGPYTPVAAPGALIYVTTPDEAIYLAPSGAANATTADALGRFGLRIAPGKPLFVTAVLAGNRRLVGLTVAPSTGSIPVAISLESTYVAEFLRRYAARAGKNPGDFDLSALPALTAQTRDMLDRGQLDAAPDLSAAAIGDLVDSYLLALAVSRKDVSDAWRDLLGFRPAAVSTVAGGAAPGFNPSGLVTGPSGDVYVAAYNSTGAEIRKIGRPDPLFHALAADGFVLIQALAPGPDGRIYFAQRVDRRLGGAVDRTGARPEIRAFRFRPEDLPQTGLARFEEVRLAVPAEIAAFVAGTDGRLEPGAMAWKGDKLYLSDFFGGLIYEYAPPADLATASVWPGQIFAGRVTDGRPNPGNATGPRLGGAAFGGITALLWHGADLLFADGENSVLRASDAAGAVRDVAGRAGIRGIGTSAGGQGDGGPPLEATFNYPQGIAVDAAGRLFIADGDNHRIRMVADGRIRTVAGGGKQAGDGDAADLAFGQITHLAFDGRGNLLFNDAEAGQVRRLWLQNGL